MVQTTLTEEDLLPLTAIIKKKKDIGEREKQFLFEYLSSGDHSKPLDNSNNSDTDSEIIQPLS